MVKAERPGFWKRLGNVIRFAQPQALPAPERDVIFLHTDPVGKSGTKSFGGYPYEEYLSALRGRQRADEFDKMRRSDPQVKMCASSVINPIMAAQFDIHKAESEDMPETEADKHKEFIEHLLWCDMDNSFDRFMLEALTKIYYGYSIFEVIHKRVAAHPKWGDYIGIENLAFRSQRTIERFNLDPQTGKLVSVSQYSYGDLEVLVDIPAQFLLCFTHEREGSNYEGNSMLRPCYGPWFRKNQFLKLNAIGIEKFAVPTPIVTFNAGVQNTEAHAALVNNLQSYTSHEKNYLMIPDTFKIEMNTNTYEPEKVVKAIEYEDKLMAKAFLANFMELGMNGSGAYALSNDLSDFFLSGLDHIANEVCGEINRTLIPQMIKLNFGPQAAYPCLKVSGISDKAGKELADSLKALADSKYIKPDDETESFIRERFGLPEADPTTSREAQPPQIPGQPGQQGHDNGGPKPKPGADGKPMSLAERIRLNEKKRRMRIIGDA